MVYLFLALFIGGLLLTVRLMFFGAERGRLREGALPLRRWEPALVAFVGMLGLTGYVLTEKVGMAPLVGTATAALLALVFATIVAAEFAGLSRVARHQRVYAALGDRMRQQIHALSMKTLTPAEWHASPAAIQTAEHHH